MLIIPAIDIREGKCVRLVEGKIDNETVYSHDPLLVAEKWEALGAKMLHLVDLDGAFSGEQKNLKIIQQITERVQIPVQTGGGIRSMERIEKLLEAGVFRVILGTAAISNKELVREACKKFEDRIVVGIDCKDGMVAVEGWEVNSNIKDIDLAREMKALGVNRIVYTDTSRDGKLAGPNFGAIAKIAEESGLQVIASGGISSPDDIRKLKKMESLGVDAAILGKALYDGKLDFTEALQISEGRMP